MAMLYASTASILDATGPTQNTSKDITMSGFIRTRLQAIRATCNNIRTRAWNLFGKVWSNCTYANLKRTVRGAPGCFLVALLSVWRGLLGAKRYLRRTCTFTNLKHAVCGSPRFALKAFLATGRAFASVVRGLLKYGKRNWKPLGLLAFSLVVMTVGLVRLHDYDVPMLRQDYKEAARGKTEYDFSDKDEAPQPDLYQKDSFFFRSVVATIHAGQQGVDLTVGDRVTAKFNNALSLYQEHRYEEAVKAFNNAYRAMSDKDGQVKRGYEKIAARTQFMIGNALCNSGKESEAISAYQLSLTYDPNDIVTIYNLERLLSKGGGSGGDKGDKPKPSNPNKTKV